MKKEFGVILFLSILVLSLSFSSAGWLSDTWSKVTGNSITGNVINSYGFNDSELYCGNVSTCSMWKTIRCGGKAGHLTAAGINLSRVSSVDVLSIKCYTGMGPAKIVSCPTTSTGYDVCVENNNDGNGNYVLLGVKYGGATPSTCTDSDGGINYYVKGNVTDASGFSPDSCFAYKIVNGSRVEDYSYSSCSGDSCRLYETFCNSYEQIDVVRYQCPNGCSNGACLNTTTPNVTCTDSDGGLNYYVAGNVTVGSCSGNSCGGGMISDKCHIGSGIDARTLEEQYCINSTTRGIPANLYDCPNGCLNGACTNTSVQVCQVEVNIIKNPTNIVIDGISYSLNNNNSYTDEYSGEINSYASWSGGDNNGHSYIWASVAEMKDSSAVQQRLGESLEKGICQVSRVNMNYTTKEYQNVYICKNIWRIAQENQQVSTGNAWNYQNDVVVLWFNDNLLFSMEFSLNNYNNCYDSESCQRIENENHQRQQSDLIAAIDKMINNKNEYTDAGYLDYRSEQFVKQFLKSCVSKVKDLGYEGSWSCRMDPAICPPHGEQKQTCTRWNQISQKDEVRETTASCNPGICSGCMVPKWFGNTWESKCIEYGFRFKQETGEFVWINNSWTSGGYQEEIDRLTVADVRKEGDLFLEIYSNNTMALRVSGWDNITHYLFNGSELNLLEILNFSLYDGDMPIQYLFKIDNIYYDSQNYGESFFDYTFIMETPIVTRNSSYQMPVYFNMYCDIDGQIKQQETSAWGACQNNYECESNLCSYGECVDLKGIAGQLTGFKGFIIRMLCGLSNPFSDQGYTQCLVDNQ